MIVVVVVVPRMLILIVVVVVQKRPGRREGGGGNRRGLRIINSSSCFSSILDIETIVMNVIVFSRHVVKAFEGTSR